MMIDPLIRWKGPFPYNALAHVGIHPHSTIKEIKAASFDLMAQGGMTADVRAAWDELRIKRRRLIVDFFLHRIDLADETDKYLQMAEAEVQRVVRLSEPSPIDPIQFDS